MFVKQAWNDNKILFSKFHTTIEQQDNSLSDI